MSGILESESIQSSTGRCGRRTRGGPDDGMRPDGAERLAATFFFGFPRSKRRICLGIGSLTLSSMIAPTKRHVPAVMTMAANAIMPSMTTPNPDKHQLFVEGL